jgi:hypothetical protein
MKKSVPVSDLHAVLIQHRVLPDGFIDRVKALKARLGDVDSVPLEKAIDNFKRDAHPEHELRIWEHIANTFQLFLSHNPTDDPEIRKDICRVLVGASMGMEDWSNIKHLKTEQINHLVLSYRGMI